MSKLQHKQDDTSFDPKLLHMEHTHDSNCDCGHHHDGHEHSHAHSDECGCGHHHDGHEHSHAHGSECGCGHHHDGHEHSHAHSDECGCGHHHDGHEESPANMPADDDGREKSIFILENLGCANCAAKMERKIKELPEVSYAAITYATKQLRITAENPAALLPQIQSICSSIESEVLVVPQNLHAKPAAGSDTKNLKEHKGELYEIIGGALLFGAGFLCEHFFPALSPFVFIFAYAVLGLEIVWTAVKNLFKGHVFDENFLMSVATLAAFAIRDFPEAVGVMLFYRVGELFEHIAVERSRSQIMEAVDMRPEVVNLVSGSEVTVIPAKEAKTGDLLLVRPGDRIPLDGTIVEGESRIDTSPVTGESVPVKAAVNDSVISGCVNTSGLLKIRVDKVLSESMVTRILDSVENAAASKPKLDRFITKFARVYTPFVVLLALGTALIPPLFTGEWNYWIYTAITFLVISCPCALVLSVPLAFFSGIGAGSKRGILFKGGVSLEALKNVKAVVMDKTGTITKGNFVLQKVLPNGMGEQELLALAAACELSSTHPIGNSILTAAREQNLDMERPSSVKELAGKGILAETSLGTALCGNKKLMDAYDIDLSAYSNDSFGAEVLVALNGRYVGCLVISDTLKDDAVSSIRTLKRYGIMTVMLTGDALASADAVAAKTGIDEVHARLLPEDKLNCLQDIRKKHGSVMFVGDGINDAPVLAGADVGAAMGSGADAAIEAADVVFMTSSMEAIPQSVSIARATGRIAMQNVVFALIIKVLVMILGLAGFANMWMAVFADTGVAMLCVLNSVRILYKK